LFLRGRKADIHLSWNYFSKAGRRFVRAAAGDKVAAAGWTRQPFAIDLGWRNFVFSLKTASAAISALALTYWLEVSDPQWATLTVYLLAQPTVGAALSRGTWRAIGTVCGGMIGLVIVALFSQAAELLVAATVGAVSVCFYLGARLRNYLSYGALLAGYTTLLVAYEGSVYPLQAWSIAVDRVAAILIGIACGTLASTIIMPRYAGDALREALKSTFRHLSAYVATALRFDSPPAVFSRLRGKMVSEVASFDMLRASALFETPEMRTGAAGLRRIIHEFLNVLAIARALYVRLDVFQEDGGQAVEAKLRPTLAAIATQVERIAADPAIWHEPGRLHGDLRAAHRQLDAAAAELEAMAGTASFEPLANGLLVINRVGDLLDRLATVVVAEAASLGGRDARAPRPSEDPPDPLARQEALLSALRAGLVLLLLSVVWMATGWNSGFTAISGGSIMLLTSVNQSNPEANARTWLVWSAFGIAIAYLVMVFVLPHLEGFEALAVVLLLLLLPAGLMAGTPSHSVAGMALGAFTIAQVSNGNIFTPNEQAYVNSGVALILGMVACLAVIAAMPVTTKARRDRSWRQAVGTLLPAVARGSASPRRASDEIVATLAGLLPRLSLDRRRDEDFFRGTLGAASSAIELGRLVDLRSDPDMPAEAALTLESFLDRFAAALESLAKDAGEGRLVEAETVVAGIRAEFSALPLAPGAAARSILRAGASLRFIADRFTIDRAYYGRGFDEN